MRVRQIIEMLSAMPRDDELWVCYDGGARMKPNVAWVSRDGRVVLGEAGEVIYGDSGRPAWAPTVDEDKYWSFPGEREHY